MIATSASQVIVIDANLAVWAAVPILAAAGIDVPARIKRWDASGTRFVAPMLWLAECTSAIRASVYDRTLTEEDGRQALAYLLTLQVEIQPLTPALCLAAFAWAGRLRQRRAYDAFYPALADELGIDLWSADQRLVNGARQAGWARAHWIGES